MKSLPATLGLPSRLDVLMEELRGANRGAVVENSVQVITGLVQYLGWLLTSPMPPEEYVVAATLSEACDAALNVLNSEPAWALAFAETNAGTDTVV